MRKKLHITVAMSTEFEEGNWYEDLEFIDRDIRCELECATLDYDIESIEIREERK